jgi:hypothetical protein
MNQIYAKEYLAISKSIEFIQTRRCISLNMLITR